MPIHEAEGTQVVIDTQLLDNAVSYLASRVARKPEIALVLGSGLGDFASLLANATEIPADAIPSYPSSTVEGHEGKLVFGTLKHDGRESLPLLVFKGRVHFYESGDLDSTTYPVRVARALGAKILLATNAAGGINPTFSEGDLMVIEDFINLAFVNPQWQDQPETGSHFQTMYGNYLDSDLSRLLTETGAKLGINLRRGSYCYLRGPSYETKAEIEMLRRIGADAVGMSTVPEIVTAWKLNMRVAAISLISNLATGLSDEPLSHKDVAETASRVKQMITSLLTDTILSIKN